MRRLTALLTVLSCALVGACTSTSALVIEDEVYISPATLAALQEIAEGNPTPPDTCHLEVIIENGATTYRCVGTCPGGKTCNLKIVKDGKKTKLFCTCQ